MWITKVSVRIGVFKNILLLPWNRERFFFFQKKSIFKEVTSASWWQEMLPLSLSLSVYNYWNICNSAKVSAYHIRALKRSASAHLKVGGLEHKRSWTSGDGACDPGCPAVAAESAAPKNPAAAVAGPATWVPPATAAPTNLVSPAQPAAVGSTTQALQLWQCPWLQFYPHSLQWQVPATLATIPSPAAVVVPTTQLTRHSRGTRHPNAPSGDASSSCDTSSNKALTVTTKASPWQRWRRVQSVDSQMWPMTAQVRETEIVL